MSDGNDGKNDRQAVNHSMNESWMISSKNFGSRNLEDIYRFECATTKSCNLVEDQAIPDHALPSHRLYYS